MDLETQKKVSAARLARISYAPFDGNSTIESEVKRANALIENGHMSPFSHLGSPDDVVGSVMQTGKKSVQPLWKNKHLHAHFDGWISGRMLIENEHVPG